MSEKYLIRIQMSSGHIEEGILESWCEKDPINDILWLVLSSKGNSKKQIRINREYIAIHEIEVINSDNIPIDKQKEINIPTTEPQKKLPFKTSLILKSKKFAEHKLAEEERLRREVSEEYSANVYDSPISILKKNV